MVWKAELRKSIRPRDEITVYSSDSILERNAYCDRGPTGAEGAGAQVGSQERMEAALQLGGGEDRGGGRGREVKCLSMVWVRPAPSRSGRSHKTTRPRSYPENVIPCHGHIWFEKIRKSTYLNSANAPQKYFYVSLALYNSKKGRKGV